jgi:membrane-bound metal-dependent hydrolase YbcI (DUF457 family)
LPGFLAATAAWAFDRGWERARQSRQKYIEAVCDGASHLMTGLAVALPASVFVENRRRFLAVSAASSVAIDIDHVLAARSVQLISCMSMPSRPASHSVLTLSALAYLAGKAWPGARTELAIGLGLGSHFLRDLATGGAPLFIPRRIVAIPRPPVAMMIMALAAAGSWYAGRILDPARVRRSNPVVLAPEALVVGARLGRVVRESRRVRLTEAA